MAQVATYESPIGPLTLVQDSERLTGVYFPGEDHSRTPAAGRDSSGDLGEVRRQLDEYFAGDRQAFDLPLGPVGTVFQRRVWSALAEIGYGVTVSYGELAKRLGDPKATRAVGLANGKNPISIIIPCHRVIGADGSLTGYGGGLDRKLWLLRHEGAILA